MKKFYVATACVCQYVKTQLYYYRDTNCDGVLNSGPLMPFDSIVVCACDSEAYVAAAILLCKLHNIIYICLQGDSYSEEADKECEQSFYAQPVQDTQPPDPSALLRPRYRYPWPVSVSDYK